MTALADLLVPALFVLLPTLVALTSFAAHTLKRDFPAVWQQEGSPESWLWLQPARPGQHVFAFLDQKRYLVTGDSSYSRLCSVARIGWYAFFILFVVTLLTLGFALFSNANGAA